MWLQGPFNDQGRGTGIEDPARSPAFQAQDVRYSLALRGSGWWTLTGICLMFGATFLFNGWWGIGIPLVGAAFLRWHNRDLSLLQSHVVALLLGAFFGFVPTVMLLGVAGVRLSDAYPMPFVESFWKEDWCRENMLGSIVEDDDLLGITRHALLSRLGDPDVEVRNWVFSADHWVIVDSPHDDLHLVAYYDENYDVFLLERQTVPARWTR